jgi:alcohol dehydrogenase class IV
MISSTKDLEKFLNNSDFKKIFILCGEKSFSISGASYFIKKLELIKRIKIYYKKSYVPVLEELITITDQIKYFNPDLILAIGGGTVIDYAKIANIVDNNLNLEEFIVNYSYPYKDKFTKLAVIPTTAGSGAEVTSNAVIYVNGIKHSFESNILIPDYYFLIPEFVRSAPTNIKASAGFDAIAQSLESLVSKKSTDTSIKFASDSLEISLNHFIEYLNKPNLDNSTQMSIAANLAGKAINISKTTAPHATSYPFSSLFGLGHGHAVSLFFENFFRFNYENISNSKTNFDLSNRFELIFKIFKVKDINGLNLQISKIKKEAKLEDNLSKLNIDVKKNSKEIMNGINILRMSNNPVEVTRDKIIKIITGN